MKILLTGMTPQQCGAGTQLGYEPVADLFVKALRHAGHDVTQAPFHYFNGAQITDWDAIVVGVVPPLSIAGKYVNNALLAIAAAEKHGVPLTLFVDDWRFPRFVTNLGTCSRLPHHLTKEFFDHRPGWSWSQDPANQARLVAVVNRLRDETWPPIIIPAYGWGDHVKLTSKLPHLGEVTTVDPTAFCRVYDIDRAEPEDRKRGWVCGVVTDRRGWLEKLGNEWPVNYIGSKSSKAETKLKETDLVNLYGGSWGVLSPVYTQVVGTGWWRNRFVYTARAHSIIFCDPREAPRLGAPYSMPIAEIEAASARDLANLADEQREIFDAWTPSVDTVASQLQLAVVR